MMLGGGNQTLKVRRHLCSTFALSLLAVGLAIVIPAPARAQPPLGYLSGFGPKAWPVVALTWGLLGISVAVVLIIGVFVLMGVWRRRSSALAVEGEPVVRGGNGLPWLYWGVGISSVALLGSLVWTVVVLAAVNGPPAPPALTIEVTGQQWWWKARYLSADPSRIFETADEVHIPVGKPVRVRLISTDVIHSFWVPKLSGKMDTIPGQVNETWIEASRPGRYAGHCAEYCGEQHANMALVVVAEPPDQFQAWWNAQLRPAPAATSHEVALGERQFEFRCGACHAVRGTNAGGTVAPDLTHLMSRSIIAGGVLPNTIANLSGWIANPQDIKPGTRMPNLYLSGPELQDIRSFLLTLK